MIVWQSGLGDDTYPYGPRCHVWEYNEDGTLMEGVLTEQQWKKKYGFLAKFECMECKFRWETKPGPLNCFKCGYIFVKWLNWKKCSKVMYK